MDPELSELLDKLKRAKKGRKKKKRNKNKSEKQNDVSVKGSTNDDITDMGDGDAEESSAFLKAKARVEEDRLRNMFPTIMNGSWLYKYPSEGSKASAASTVETYPRKCRACSTWLSSKTSYEQHLIDSHSNKHKPYANDKINDTVTLNESDKKQTHEHMQQLGVPRKYFFKLDTKSNQINWYFNDVNMDKQQSKIAGNLALDSVIKISVGVSTPGVEMPKPEFINDYFTLQAKGRYVVLRASNAPNAHSWVRELRVAVFELGQPPPGNEASETLFSIINNKGNNLKNDESVTAMAIERLVSNNPDMVNVPNEDGDTPLLVATKLNLSHVVQILLSLGANVSLLGKRNNSVLHIACKNAGMENKNKNKNMDSIDINNDEKTNNSTTTNPGMKIIKTLLDIQFVEKILDVRRDGGATCLHDIASVGNVQALQLLLEKNANPYNCDDYNRTPLHVACSQGESEHNTEVVSLLCELIEDTLDWQDFEGNTALHLAARIGNFNAVQQLLQTAANPSIKNTAGATAYDISLANNYEEIAVIIEEYNILNEESNEDDNDKAYEEEETEIIDHVESYNSYGPYYNSNAVKQPVQQHQQHQNQLYNHENTSPYNNNSKQTYEKGPIPPYAQQQESYHHRASQQQQQAWAAHQIQNMSTSINNKNLSDTSAPGYSLSEREWGEAVTEDGRRYFFNTVTGRTQWEIPLGWQQPQTVQHATRQQQATKLGINESNTSPNLHHQHHHHQKQQEVRIPPQQQQQMMNALSVGNIGLTMNNSSGNMINNDNNVQMANRLSHPSPPPAINTSPHQSQPRIHHHQHQRQSPSPTQQYSPPQQHRNNNNTNYMGGYSPQSTSSNSSYLTSPRGTPNVSPHVSPQHPSSQGRQFRSRYDPRMMNNVRHFGRGFGQFPQQQQQQQHSFQQPWNVDASMAPSQNKYYQKSTPTMNSGNSNANNNNNRPAPDHNKTRFIKATVQNLAHVISPMNLDNPALNKRLIEERRRAREERRKKIRKSRKGRR